MNGTDIPPNIAAFTASPVIGALLNWALFGVLTVQVYIYYLNFPGDKTFSKCLVYGTYSLELIQTVISAADMYYWFAAGFGNMERLGNVHFSPFDTPLLCGIIAGIVQCFFAYRIWTLQRRLAVVVWGVLLTALIQLVGSLITCVKARQLRVFDRFHESTLFTASFYMWLLGDTVSDILIAGAMLWIVYNARKNDRHFRMSKILLQLVRLIVETNTLTASMALISFILFVIFRERQFYLCTALVMGKLYSNTLLVTFNNRIALRKATGLQEMTSHSHSDGFSVPRHTRSLAANRT
jgi:hypothetical protein